MDPVALIPAPDALPVHWFWLQLLLTVTTFLHLVAMNVLLGGGAWALVTSSSGRHEDHLLAKSIGHKLPFVLAITINFGVAPLLFLQTLYGQFFYTSTVLMAVYWLAIVGLLIVTYYAAYLFHLRFEALPELRIYIMGLAMVLLLVIAFLFTNNISLMQLPESWHNYFANRQGGLINSADPTLWPRYLHFIASGIAVGSLAVALLYDFRKKRGAPDCDRWIKLGCYWFGSATIVNFGIGFWFFGVLPAASHDMSTLAGKLFALALLGSVVAGALSVIKAMSIRVVGATIWTLITLFFMVVARDLVRVSYLKPYLSLGDLPVDPQYSPFVLFVLFFGAIIVLTGWMLKLVWKAQEVQS